MGWALFGDINLGVWAYGYVYYEVWTPPGFIWMWIFSDVTVGKKRARAAAGRRGVACMGCRTPIGRQCTTRSTDDHA